MAGFREWREHKYIRKEGNRYIYPEDLQRTDQRGRTTNERISRDRKIREAKEERDRLIREAQEQTRKHDNSLLNRIDQAGKAAGKALTDAGNTVGDAATNTYKKGRKFITDLFTDASKTFENTVGSTVAKGVHKARKVAHDTGKYFDEVNDEINRKFRKATKPRDEKLSKEDRAARQYEANYKRMTAAREALKDAGSRKDWDKSSKALKYYDKTQRAFKNAPGTAESIGADLEKKKDAVRKKKARKEAIAKIFEKPKHNAQNPFDRGEQEKDTETKNIENGRDKGYPSSASKRKSPKVNTRFVEKTTKETITPEKIITEDIIPENITTEKTIKEKKTPSYLRPDSTNAVGRAAENNYKSAIAWYNAQRKKGLSDAAIRKLPKFNKYANTLYGQMGKLGWTRTPNNIPKKRPKVNNNVQTWDNSTTTWDNVQIKAFEKKRKKSK